MSFFKQISSFFVGLLTRKEKSASHQRVADIDSPVAVPATVTVATETASSGAVAENVPVVDTIVPTASTAKKKRGATAQGNKGRHRGKAANKATTATAVTSAVAKSKPIRKNSLPEALTKNSTKK